MIIVVPVRNDAEGLSATVAAVTAEATADGRADPSIVIVDDASAVAVSAPGSGASPARMTLIRRDGQGGPAAARNDGWRSAPESLVAFVDANCEPDPGWLDHLLPHFADPLVGAVAPRIIPATGAAASRSLAAYEAVSSPLDLGDREAIVRPRSPVAYVPTAALVVRRRALEALGGFDEALTVGEDVDFVWRLVTAGWTVRYEPRATVRHPVRPDWWAWLAQRYRYGTSAAALARRHGTAVAPLVVSPWTAAAWGLVAAGRPALGALAAGYSVAALAGLAPHRNPALGGPGRTPSACRPGRLFVWPEPATSAGVWPSPGPCAGPGRRPPSPWRWPAAAAGRPWPPPWSCPLCWSGSTVDHGWTPSGSWPCGSLTIWPTPPGSGPAAPGSVRAGPFCPTSLCAARAP